MVILAHPIKGKQKSVDICNAFAQGAPKSLIFANVFYGVNETNRRDWEIVKRSGQDWYFVDNSYFDAVRGRQFRITKNAVQIDASCGGPTDGKRFAALGLTVKPHHPASTGYALVVEQSPSFMLDVAQAPRWLDTYAAFARSVGHEVKTRPWNRDKLKAQTTLKADLQGARYVITHSSAAAVEALLDGLSVVTSPMSAVTSIDEERKLFAMGVLADNQWTIDEIKSGKAWSWLNRER